MPTLCWTKDSKRTRAPLPLRFFAERFGVTTVEFPVEGGDSVLVRVDTLEDGAVVTRGLVGSGPVERAQKSFEDALGTIRTVADAVLAQLAGLARHPDEIKVEFGLELTANAKAMVVAAGTTAHLQVGLTWRPSESDPFDEPGRT
jgi:hypothetical protein